MSQQTKKINAILSDDETTLGQIISKAQALSQLNEKMKAVLDEHFHARYQIASCENGVLTFLTDNAATATQLRYRTPELLSQLRQYPQWAGLIKINTKVHQHWHEYEEAQHDPREPERSSIVPEQAKKDLEKLIETLKDDPKNEVIIKSLKKLLHNR